MRQIILATEAVPLKIAVQQVGERHAAVVLEPHDFADLVFNDPTVVVLDPLCLPRAEWQTYIDYLDDLSGEDSTPLVLLKRHEDAEALPLPTDLAGKPEGTLFQVYDDDVPAIIEIVEEAMLGTRNQWNLSAVASAAPNILELEESFIAQHHARGLTVTFAQPVENTAGCAIFQRLSEIAGFDSIVTDCAIFLTFDFAEEKAARAFMARLPSGMAFLYANGELLDVN